MDEGHKEIVRGLIQEAIESAEQADFWWAAMQARAALTKVMSERGYSELKRQALHYELTVALFEAAQRRREELLDEVLALVEHAVSDPSDGGVLMNARAAFSRLAKALQFAAWIDETGSDKPAGGLDEAAASGVEHE